MMYIYIYSGQQPWDKYK